MAEILSKFCYPDSWGKKREPIRPIDLRVINFEKLYDYDTIWNDAVQINKNRILLIGPPLYDTKDFLIPHCNVFDPTGNDLRCKSQEMDRACVVHVETHDWIDHVIFYDGKVSYKIPVNHISNIFNNKKVIVTISKNHPISWLKQWIDYHKVVHNVEGLLLYNNQSTIYTSQQLEQQLIRDDMIIKVVDYDVPFGVMGGGDWEWEGRKGTYLPWDSDFAQYVQMEHAKWRYLHCAKLAINADTDELLIIKSGHTLDQVADYCETGEHSVLLYDGIWIEPIDSHTNVIAKDISFEERNFSNYYHTEHSNGRGIGVKWLLNPKRNLQYQWHLHKTYGPHIKTSEITFGHYFAMNTSWSYQRDNFTGDKFKLIEVGQLKRNLDMWKNNSVLF